MKNTLMLKNGIIIPDNELEITASRAGGPGGQHVNKTSSRITIRWNVKNTHALSDEQKQRVLEKVQTQLTTEGDLVIHSSTARSQQQNKDIALKKLALIITKALHIPKKRMKTRVSATAKERRLQAKTHHGLIKKMRSKKFYTD